MKLPLSDSHAHLAATGVFEEIDAILVRAQEAGVEKIVNICTNEQTLSRGIQLGKNHSWIYNTAATTPHDVDKEGESFFPIVEKHAKEGSLVAIGETGLDYHYEHSPRDLQKKYLKKYLALAQECKLPVVIHCRDAFADFFEIIDSDYNGPGVLHCFTGTLDEAKEVVKRGWMLSLSGIVTFKKSTGLQEVAKWVPLDHLLIETDTPYLAPQKHRGKRNEPGFLAETCRFIADLKDISAAALAKATTDNCARLFFK